jgi:hypothetical protein
MVDEPTATRTILTARFRRIDAGEDAKMFVDPRLPRGAETAVVGLLNHARIEARQRLGLQPPTPDVFVYLDQELMKAAACTNEDVVAFYDGAIHLVLGRPDLQRSVTHEYAHHALFSSGLVAPAWAQEGIAMNLAGETWWQQRSQLKALLLAPFSAEDMDEQIPYKLSAQQAVVFYVQAALTVQCLLRRRGWSLQQLADTLRDGTSTDSVTYGFAELADRSFLTSCATLR